MGQCGRLLGGGGLNRVFTGGKELDRPKKRRNVGSYGIIEERLGHRYFLFIEYKSFLMFIAYYVSEYKYLSLAR